MDAEKYKKLQQYATILTDQAKDAEQSGKSEDAIKHYLKLVDVYLVLASEAPDHNTWMQHIRQAEAYQTTIRSLVPKDQATQDIVSRIPPPPAERDQGVGKRPDLGVSRIGANSQTITPSSTPRSGSISKIFRPFQSGKETTLQEDLITSTGLTGPANIARQSSSLVGTTTQVQPQTIASNQSTQKVVPPQVDERLPVPHELNDRALSENKILHERLQSIVKESDDKVAFLESRNRELEDRVAMMVSKEDYDQLREEFENTVPKHEYDRLKTELSNTVPVTHYDQLLDRIANMVPREIYMASVKRVLELEDSLRNSVPFTVIEDIANEVSIVSILAEVPPIPIDDDGLAEKKETKTAKKDEISDFDVLSENVGKSTVVNGY